MPDIQSKLATTALIAKLVAQANRPGRTAIMKYLYFMKALRGVPLPYHFRLYTYGPFDGTVLNDLRYAEALGAVESELVPYRGGRGYEYQRGARIDEVEEHAADFLSRHEEDIAWVLRVFGNRSASDLEMASTLVYVDRSLADKGARSTLAALAKKVHDVKPHLSMAAIENEAGALAKRGLLKSVH
jgi:uncharacterized protein